MAERPGRFAFILRYRLQPYNSATDALADTQRSIRMIRANAKEWGVNPAKVGIMGFSAGGEQAARGASISTTAIPRRPIRSKSRATVPISPCWSTPAGAVSIMSKVPADAPPSFLTSAGVDDAFHAKETVDFYNALFNAKIPVELHIYGHGGHANGIKPRGGIPFGTRTPAFLEGGPPLALINPVF